MQVKLSSGEYDIISSGQAFTFGDPDELAIDIVELDIHLLLRFLSDETGEIKTKVEIAERQMVISCTNFSAAGTGVNTPVQIADAKGRPVFLIFWTNLEGSKPPRARSVKYTVFWKR